eukprot:gene47305-54308_t
MGEFDIERMLQQRPILAALFFFSFFVIVTVVLFNLTIAVVSDAYAQVCQEQFDSSSFVARVAHDPETTMWMPAGAGFAPADTVVVREFVYWWSRF